MSTPIDTNHPKYQDYLTETLCKGKGIAENMFQSSILPVTWEIERLGLPHKDLPAAFFDSHMEHYHPHLVFAAREDLLQWKQKSGREQQYTPGELAAERLIREVILSYESKHGQTLDRINTNHQALVSDAIQQSGLAEKMIAEGKAGRKLGVVETTARITPCLNFYSSSHFFVGAAITYSSAMRDAFGEPKQEKQVSQKTALESARNLQERLGMHYALAETAAAPSDSVPRSRMPPRTHIVGLAEGVGFCYQDTFPEVMFRSQFDAIVREEMLFTLLKMYGVQYG